MAEETKRWYLRNLPRWQILRSVPMSRLWALLTAACLLFSVSGFYSDLRANGTRPYAVVLMIAAYAGLNACAWILVVARLPIIAVVGMIAMQFVNGWVIGSLAKFVTKQFHLKAVAPQQGIAFAATSILFATILSYVFFLRFIVAEGKQSLRIQGELELAHAIQRTLVPPVHLRTERFEIYGSSHPSDKVGGDLVDAVLLPNGDAIAYLADVAGHGLPASILMGRVKTAIRTALLDASEREPGSTLPLLLERLNTVLPHVKDPQMYATFTGFRFGVDGSVFCAMAASPPLLHWHAAAQGLSSTQEPQLPLGLLPVPSFEGFCVQTSPGDLLVVATDGILEVCDRQEDEFGVDRLKAMIAGNSEDALEDLSEKVLKAVRQYGRQFDDQTMLLVRCL